MHRFPPYADRDDLLFFIIYIAAAADDGEPLLVSITFDQEIAESLPYNRNGAYQRDLCVPLLNGERGYRYRQTNQVNTWLFPVDASHGVADLVLHLDADMEPLHISINGQTLTSGISVTLPLTDTAELRISDAKRRTMIRLCFTTLPVIEIRPEDKIFRSHDSSCTIKVTDPLYREHGETAMTSDYVGTITRRGNSSSHYNAKHPYNFTLLKDGEKWDHSLLGLRTDSDWILDSAYNDRSRMRNRALMDVWDDVYRLPWDRTRSGATDGTYVELFINDTYKGLFALGEKQDRQQLGLAKTGGKWNSSYLRTGQTSTGGYSPAGFVSLGTKKPGASDPQRWYNVELRYPVGDSISTSEAWQDFYDYTQLVIKGSKSEFAEKITQYADLDNLARYWLYANATDINDNMRKNMTFARYDDRDERFNRYILIPWDMDSSLGRYYTSKKSKSQEIITNRLFKRLMDENPGDFQKILYDDWQELRDGALSLDSIMAKFDAYYRQIHQAGADEREMKTHPTFTSYAHGNYSFKLDFEQELAYIREFTEKRLAWLDQYINSLYH